MTFLIKSTKLTAFWINTYYLRIKIFFLLFFWINILPSSLLSSYYLLPLACFDMWFRTKCFSMKKIDYAKKTHLSFFFFCLFAELGHPYTSYTAERKSFRSSCSPGGGGPKVVYMRSSLLQLAVGSRDLFQAEKEISVLQSWWHFPRTNISFTSYKQLIQILKFSNDFFVYLLFEYLYKVKVFN